MASFNKVLLMGNLTRDPQLKYLPNNTPVCEFGMAVNRKWRDRDGNQREEVCYVDLAAFARQAETLNQYMSKGKPIFIEGRLKFDSWTGQDGQKRSKLSVVVDNFQFVGAREGGGGGGYQRRDSGGGHDRGQAPVDDGPPNDYMDDQPPAGSDIPF